MPGTEDQDPETCARADMLLSYWLDAQNARTAWKKDMDWAPEDDYTEEDDHTEGEVDYRWAR